MISIFADYAPETQRKDKFKLDMRVTRKQQSVLEQEPFFSLYLNKYGSMIMPVYVLSSIFNKICPRLSDFKLIRTKEIDKKWATQSKFGAYTLTSEKTKDGFILEFDCHKPNLPIAQLLSMVYQIPQSANYTEYADDGTVKQPIITEFKSYLDQAFTVGLAGTRLTFNTDSLKKFFKTEEEKLSFSCIKSLVIEINRNYEFSTHFSILLSAKEAELLTRLEYSAIRNIDIFPIIAHWIVGNYEQGPTTSISLSRIASHVDPSSVQYAKINEHGLTINQKGEILYIPREVNNSKEYEAQYIAYCSSDDVTDRKFGFRYGVSPTSEKKLPANMMILVDWTNAKFTYANSNGVQTTMDLSQCRPLTATHVRNVFRRTILSPEYLSNLSLFGMTVELTTNQVRVNADGELMDMDDYLKRLMGDLPSGQYYTLYDMLGDSRFDPIVKTISIIANAIEKKRDSFIARYAISNWISVLGLAKAIAVYASDWAKYKGEDELIRSAAVNQEITKGWELPSVPFFNNAPGLMPHQARVMNMMKDDPAFTLLPVAAGGGKCLCGETFVQTDKGLMQLEQIFNTYKGEPSAIQEGFYQIEKPLSVLSAEGNFEPVSYLYTCKGKVSALTLSDGTIIRGLGKHRFYTQNGWKKFKDLTTNDYVLKQPSNYFARKSYRFVNRDYIKEATDRYACSSHSYKIDELAHTTIPTKMSKALAFILGAIVAEGTSKHEFFNNDSDFIKRYKKAVKSVFNIDLVVSKDKDRATKLSFSNLAVTEFLSDILGSDTHSWNRFVPDCVLQSKKEHWIHFLRAFFEGDGECCGIERDSDKKNHDGRINCYSTSKRLASQVFEMLKCLGFHPTFVFNTKAKARSWESSYDTESHTNYIVKLPVSDNQKFFDLIGFASKRKNDYLELQATKSHVSTNGQDSNLTSQGWFNQLPTREKALKFIERLESKLDQSQFRETTRSTFPQFIRQACRDNGFGLSVLNKLNTRYSIGKLIDLVESDSRLYNTVFGDKKLNAMYEHLQDLLSRDWCKVVEVKHDIGTEQVYDLSMPSTHAWVANGYLGHNTPIAIMDILKLYSEGKNAPYMVLCPNNLVSQYVQEVMYFTKGRLNTIPITTAVVKREGLDRLQKIFEAAPRNTLVVVSYNAIKYNSHRIIYGTNTVTRYPIVEFLRQFKFGYALCDESHQLKSIDSIKSLAVRMLLSDIPCIRLASGTLAYNRITDLVGQTAIMDPSIFGDMQTFRYEYGKFESGKYLGLKKGAESEINARIKESIVVAGAQRKEWAALLPQTETSYHMVHLSPIEQDIYEQVLSITADNLEANPSLRKAMAEIEKLKEEQKIHYDQDRQDIIDEREDKLGKRLTPYLQKLERLVVDPLKESAMMTEIPPNYVSEKVRKVVEIAEKHVFGSKKMVNRNGVPTEVVESLPVPGKIIVFTENIDSAKSVYEGFQKVGSRLAKNGLLYEASNKQELLEKFNTDPNIKWMVGVETSINTGLNLQAASRIIRAEYPWQPGALEQGNARILRPLLKSKDGRTTVFFDWVVCDGTIDTLKVSRLMAKSAEIARFEHPHDERYQKVGVSKDMFTGTEENQIPVISVTMKNIRAHLDFGSDVNPGPLYPYYVAMRDLHFIEKNDYENYRKEHPEEINPDGTMKSVPVPIEKNPKDAKLLRYVPYVEGTNLYHAGELGLQRLDEYLNAVQQDYDDEDDKSTFEADEQYKELVKSLKGETVYTEYGECYIYAVSAKKPLCKVIPVNTTDRIEMPISSVFLITRKNVKPAQLHKAIAKEIGIVEYSEPSYVRPSGAIETERGLKVKDDSTFEIERRDESQLQLNLRVVLINGLLGFRFTEIDEHELGTAILEQNGFRLVPDYYRAQIKNYKMLSAWLKKMSESGFKFRAPYDYSGAWQQIAKAMKRSQVKQVETFSAPQTLITNIVTTGDLKTMLRWNVKPTTNQTVLRVQPMFSNGVVFAIMPSTKLYPAGNIIRRKRVSGMKWELGPKAYEIYFTKPQEALRCLTALQKDGITITNLAHVKKSISKARSKRFDDIDSIKEKSVKEKRRRLSVREVLDRKRNSKMADDDYEIQIIDDTKTKRKPITKKVKQKPVTKNVNSLGRRRLSVREVLERKRGL